MATRPRRLVGYGDEASTAVIELTHNWETTSYDLGNGFGHIALGTDDIVGACGRVRDYGGQVTREPGPMKHGTTVIAFAKDPDGNRRCRLLCRDRLCSVLA